MPYGNKLSESQSFYHQGRGKIVIDSNRCFIPEVITHDVNGLLCDYDDHHLVSEIRAARWQVLSPTFMVAAGGPLHARPITYLDLDDFDLLVDREAVAVEWGR